ncbi:ComEC/Rec2 family competence protein [Paenirhodobacter populi]|uniref:ComEC/Rec2 family competence protein n=1 Tax=Paenirhodobacter populi TaxID=2306993 RepID=UPI00240E3F7E|nr:ComEC/Rec2 family competence protein [Sinirhodobacter populi]
MSERVGSFRAARLWGDGARWRAGFADPGVALARARADLVLWMPVAIGCGGGVYFALRTEPSGLVLAVLLAVMVAGVAGLLRGPEALRLLAGLVAFAALGFLLSAHRTHSVAAPVLDFRYYGPVEGRIVKVDRSSRDLIRLTLDRVTLKRVAPERTPERVRVSLHGVQDHLLPEPGMRVMLTANLMAPNGPAEPGGWDYRRTAWFERLGAVGYSRTPVMLVEGADPHDLALAGHRVRMAISRAMQERMPGQAGAVAAALMTGDRSGITEATNEVMRISNLYHIVSISGLHMAMLAGFVFAAIRYGLAACGNLALILPAKKIAAAAALVAASVYLWIAGPEVATQRSYIMAAVMLLAVLFDRRALSLRTVAIAAVMILIARPESLTEPGFQMSFAATVGLIVSNTRWAEWSRPLPHLLRPAIALLFTSLVAGIVTGPIAAAHFNRGSGYGLLANFLAVPVMGTLVMPGGVIAAVLAPFGLAAPALWVMDLGTRWMILVAEWVAGLKGASVMVMAPPAAVLPVMSLGAVVAVLARGPLRMAGMGAVAVSMVLWTQAERPVLLVSSGAEIVGLAGPEGRGLSKPVADFVASSWLAADGDGATVAEAAARPVFTGDRGARVANWQGRAVVHLTGKAGLESLPQYCRDGALVILAGTAPAEGAGSCEIWDQPRLRDSGALAFDARGDVTWANAVSGMRPWTVAGRWAQ